MVYQETTQYWEKLYFEITPLYCSVSVIILSCEDTDKFPFYLAEIWQKVKALYPLQSTTREEGYTYLGLVYWLLNCSVLYFFE